MPEGSNYNIFNRRDKIHSLIIDNNIREATMSSLDLVKEFAPHDNVNYTTALIICADSAQYEESRRLGTLNMQDLQLMKRDIIVRMCAIIDSVIQNSKYVA